MREIDWLPLFKGKVLKEQYVEYESDMAGQNLWVHRIMVPVVTLFELYNIIKLLFFNPRGISTPRNCSYFVMYTILFFVSIAWSFFIYRKKRQQKMVLMIGGIFIAVFVLWSTGISILDSRLEAQFTVYYTAIVSVAVFYLMPPWQTTLVFGMNYVLMLLGFFARGLTDKDYSGELLNMTIITVTCIGMSLYRHGTRWLDFRNKWTILKQNEQIKQINQQLNHLVLTDTLMEIYNRRFLTDLLPEKWEDAARKNTNAAIVMMDIDDFKIYNDTYGHQEGDCCLQKIAQVMKECVKTKESYVVRYGGEEICIIFFGWEKESVSTAAKRVREEVERLNIRHKGSPNNHITISVGVHYGKVYGGEEEREQFFKAADDALYCAKGNGKNKIVEN